MMGRGVEAPSTAVACTEIPVLKFGKSRGDISAALVRRLD